MHPNIHNDSVDDKRVCESLTWNHWIKLNCKETEAKFDVSDHCRVEQVKSHSDE
jgi:hypothetical protein